MAVGCGGYACDDFVAAEAVGLVGGVAGPALTVYLKGGRIDAVVLFLRSLAIDVGLYAGVFIEEVVVVFCSLLEVGRSLATEEVEVAI